MDAHRAHVDLELGGGVGEHRHPLAGIAQGRHDGDDLVVDAPLGLEPHLTTGVDVDAVVGLGEAPADLGGPLLGGEPTAHCVAVQGLGEGDGSDRIGRQVVRVLERADRLGRPVADHAVHVEHHDLDRHPRPVAVADLLGHAGEDAVHELRGVIRAAVAAAELHGLGQAHAGRDVELGGQLEHAEAQHHAVHGGHALHRPAVGVAVQHVVDLGLVVGDAEGQLERVGIGPDGEAGDHVLGVHGLGVGLVEQLDGALARLPAGAGQAHARDWYWPVRVSIFSFSPVLMNSGTCTT